MNVHCPHCKKLVPWTAESRFRPFCSERCRIIDLGAWADGSYTIPTNENPLEEGGYEDEGNDSFNNPDSDPPNTDKES